MREENLVRYIQASREVNDPLTLMLCDCGTRFMARFTGSVACPECGSIFVMDEIVEVLDKPAKVCHTTDMDINPQQKESDMSTVTASLRVFNANPLAGEALAAALVAAAGTLNLEGNVRVEVTTSDELGRKVQTTSNQRVFAEITDDEGFLSDEELDAAD